MTLEVLDQISLAGRTGKANEDAFAARTRAAIVLDGATGLGEQLLPGPSDAAWLSRFGANRIMSYVGDGARARDAITAALFDAHISFEHLRKRAPKENYEMPFASLMLAVEDDTAIEFAWYGDCAAIVGRAGGEVRLIGEALAKRARESARAKSLAESKGEAVAGAGLREAFLPALRAARNLVNTERGGYLFGPDVIAADHVATERVGGVHDILLTSDGFLALASDYGRYTAETLLASAKQKGLEALATELRDIEANDPDGKQFPRFKKSDDATAVLLRAG